jgi:hypothetical protein
MSSFVWPPALLKDVHSELFYPSFIFECKVPPSTFFQKQRKEGTMSSFVKGDWIMEDELSGD